MKEFIKMIKRSASLILLLSCFLMTPRPSAGQDIYVGPDGNPDFPDERAGSNDSDKDNFIEGDGWDNFFRLRFKYLLPIGHGKDTIINTYVVDRGMLKSGATGAKSWNPMTSGRTYFELLPFYRWQEIKGDDEDIDI